MVPAATLLLVSMLGFLGSRWWVFDLVSNLRAHLAVASVLLTVGLVVPRCWGAAATAAAGAALNLMVVVPVAALILFGSPAPAASGAAALEITFFNTKFWADRDATIAALGSRDDDVVVLALAVGIWGDDLADADLGGLHVRTGPHLDADREFGLVAMTRNPEAEVIVHRRTDDPRDALVEIVVDHEGGPVHVLAGHPPSPVTAERAARRDAMLRWIGDWARDRHAPVVVVGDLNAPTWSTPMRTLLDESGLSDSRVGHGLQPSWPVDLGPLGLTIDHVLHSDDLTTLDRRLTPVAGSDHPMVHARLARRAPDD